MKFESLNSDTFKHFEDKSIENLNAILGGYKSETNNNAATIAAGGNGNDTYHSETDTVTDDGHPIETGGVGRN